MRETMLAAVTALGMLAVSAQAQANEKVTFSLNWFPVGDHAAYWVALEKGYFADLGLDVTLVNSKGSGDSIAKVDTGRADAGLADSSVVIASRARGATVKVVGMVFDITPLNIFSRADAPVVDPKGLEGKTIGAPPGDGQRLMWPAFAKANDIDESKVTWVSIEPTAKVAALAEKRVDTVADYTTGLPLYEKPMGAGNVAMMPWAEHGLDLYSMSIIASEATIANRPDVLRKILRAAYRGWRDVMTDQGEALTIFKKRVPEIDEVAIGANIKLGLKHMMTDRYAKNGIGWIEDEKMCNSVDLVNTYMDLPMSVDCKDVFTTEYLPEIDMPPLHP